VATTSGKKRLKDVPDFPFSSTVPASLKARQRKPSHFGSYCHSSGSFGSDSADLASIGAVSCRKGYKSRNSIPCVFRAFIREPSHSSPSAFDCSRSYLLLLDAVAQRAQAALVPKQVFSYPLWCLSEAPARK